MFEQALYEDLVSNLIVAGFDDLTIHFGEAPEETKQPYIVMFSLDSDGSPQTVCDDLYDSGASLIQFNIYSQDISNGFFIKNELDKYLFVKRTLTIGADTYKISLLTHNASPSANTLVNGLAVNVLAKTYNYYKGA